MAPAGEKIEQIVSVTADRVTLQGDLSVPAEAGGIVLFAHGSGSSRFSPRNRYVAEVLQRAGLATLLLDLLTDEEEVADSRTGHLRFNIPLLAGRLSAATEWIATQATTRSLPIGYFGASTGAAAALVAAASRRDVRAVVSRGGRPDLAGDALPRVQAPTLLIVGGADRVVLELNEQARDELVVRDKRLEVIPRATHLFEEPGALEKVAELARDWFLRFLSTKMSIEAA
jgi:putative phosphoribosyl transferase